MAATGAEPSALSGAERPLLRSHNGPAALALRALQTGQAALGQPLPFSCLVGMSEKGVLIGFAEGVCGAVAARGGADAGQGRRRVSLGTRKTNASSVGTWTVSDVLAPNSVW
jgi:hypothetical protein